MTIDLSLNKNEPPLKQVLGYLFSSFIKVELFFAQVVDETDLDEDERIDFDEFQQIISRAPDFLRYTYWFCKYSMFSEENSIGSRKHIFVYWIALVYWIAQLCSGYEPKLPEINIESSLTA